MHRTRRRNQTEPKRNLSSIVIFALELNQIETQGELMVLTEMTETDCDTDFDLDLNRAGWKNKMG